MNSKAPQKKSSQKNIHDALFREIYSHKKYSLDIFRLVLTPAEFRLFNWKTLKSEATIYLDPQWQSKAVDLVFNVKLKNSKKQANLVFLLEHKSYKDGRLLQQLLEYQARIYSKQKNPIIPILVYHGKEKKWGGPLRFRDSLKSITPAISRYFGNNILDFSCRLLNLQNLASWEKRKDLTTTPILFIMSHIWRLDDGLLEKFFKLCRDIKDDEAREVFQTMGMDYVHQNDFRKFSWKKIEEVEQRTLDEEERAMPALKSTLELVKKEGREEGWEEGREEGREEGIKETVLELLKNGVDPAILAKSTKFTREQIDKLKKGRG